MIPWNEWDEISSSPDYAKLSIEDKTAAKLGWFVERATKTEEFANLDEPSQIAILTGFVRPTDKDYGPKPGILKEGAKGVVRGVESIAGSIGGLTRWAGDVIGSETMSEAGKTASKYWQDEAQKGWEAPDPRINQGTFIENPSFARAAGLVGEAVPWLAPALISGGAMVAAGISPLAASATVAGGMGVMEGSQNYEEARDVGKGVGESSVYGALSSAGTAILEFIPIGKFLGKKTGLAKGAVEGLLAEGITEGAQTAWQNLIAKVGYDGAREISTGVIESMIAGAGTGAPAGALTHGIGKAVDAGVSESDIKTVIEDIEKQTDAAIIDQPDKVKQKVQESVQATIPKGKKETFTKESITEPIKDDVPKVTNLGDIPAPQDVPELPKKEFTKQDVVNKSAEESAKVFQDAIQSNQSIEGAEELKRRLAAEQQAAQERAAWENRPPTTYQQEVDPLSVEREMMRDKLRKSPEERAIETRGAEQARNILDIGPIEAERMLNEYERRGLDMDPKLRAQLQDIIYQTATPGQRINRPDIDYSQMERKGQPWQMGTDIGNAYLYKTPTMDTAKIEADLNQTSEPQQQDQLNEDEKRRYWENKRRELNLDYEQDDAALEESARKQSKSPTIKGERRQQETQTDTTEPSAVKGEVPVPKMVSEVPSEKTAEVDPEGVAKSVNTTVPGNNVRYDGTFDRSEIGKPPLYHFTAMDGRAKGASFSTDNPTVEGVTKALQEKIDAQPKDTPSKEPWETSDLAEAPNIPASRIQSRKRPDGKYQLFYRGTKNEVFPGQLFDSVKSSRDFFKAQQVKAQEAYTGKRPIPADIVLPDDEGRTTKAAKPEPNGENHNGVVVEKPTLQQIHQDVIADRKVADKVKEYGDSFGKDYRKFLVDQYGKGRMADSYHAKATGETKKLSTKTKGTGITAKTVEDSFKAKGFKTETAGDKVTVSTPSGKIEINIADSIVEDDGATISLSYKREAKPGEKVAGSYSNGKIELKKNLADQYTLVHEVFHHMKAAGLFTPIEQAILKRHGNEESQARWVESKLEQRGELKGAVKRLIQKIADFIDAVANLVGINTERGFLRKIESGEILKRKGTIIDSDGVKLSTTGDEYAQPESMLDRARLALARPLNDFMYWIVDKNYPIQTIQNKLKKVTDNIDVFLKETQRSKVTAAKQKKFWDDDVKVMIDFLSEKKIEIPDLEEYVHAMHATEANDALRKSNAKRFLDQLYEIIDEDTAKELKHKFSGKNTPEENYGNLQAAFEMFNDDENVVALKESFDEFSIKPSGMTDADAKKIIKLNEGNADIEKARKMLADINDKKLDTYFNAGLLPKEEYKAIKQKYKYYVPLYREGFDDSLFGSSRGIKPSGRPVKTRAGSSRNVVNILANSVANMERAINAAEKANTQRSLLGLIKANPDPNFWTIKQENKTPRHDEYGNIRYYPDIFNVKDDELRIMVDGKQYFIKVDRNNKDAMLMLRTLKAEDGMAGPIVNTLAKLNRFLAKINTTWSPEFIISNFIRDIQTAGINIKDTGVEGKGMFTGAMKAWKAIYAVESGKPKNTDLEKMYERFKLAGGKIGWSDVHGSVENLSKKITAELEMQNGKRPIRKTIKGWLDLIENANTSIENGVRLHTFKLAVEQGITDERAAQIASDLTVDFTKKGTAGPVINSLYLFANAGIQGSYRIIRAATKSQQVQKMLAGIIGAGFVVGMLNSMAGTDEDGEDYYNKIDDFVRERNMIIVIPGTKGKYAKIPLPWGYNVFWNLGSEFSRAITKKDFSPMSSAGRMASYFAGAFNPVQSGTLLQTLSPTVSDPFVQVAENKTWFGGDMMPAKDKYARIPEPDSQRYWKSASSGSKWVASTLNSLTGGNKIKPGGIDVSPETLDLVVDTVGGSAFRFFKDTFGVTQKAISGEEIAWHKVPFLRRMAGEQPEWANSRTYYGNVENVLQVEAQLKAYKGTEYYNKVIKSEPELIKLIPHADRTEKRLRVLRKQLKKADAAGNEKVAESVKKQMDRLYNQFNKLYNDTI